MIKYCTKTKYMTKSDYAWENINQFYTVSETQMPQHPMTKQEKSVSTRDLDKKPGICSAC